MQPFCFGSFLLPLVSLSGLRPKHLVIILRWLRAQTRPQNFRQKGLWTLVNSDSPNLNHDQFNKLTRCSTEELTIRGTLTYRETQCSSSSTSAEQFLPPWVSAESLLCLITATPTGHLCQYWHCMEWTNWHTCWWSWRHLDILESCISCWTLSSKTDVDVFQFSSMRDVLWAAGWCFASRSWEAEKTHWMLQRSE